MTILCMTKNIKTLKTLLNIAIGLSLGLAIVPMQISYANDNNEDAKPAQSDNKLPSGTFSSKSPTNVPTYTVLAIPPHQGDISRLTNNPGRFGDFRWRNGRAGFHQGIDINGINYNLFAPFDGRAENTSWGVQTTNNEGTLVYGHAKFILPKTSTVKAGDRIAFESSRATSNVHLHLEHIPTGSKPVFDVWLGERGKGGQFGNNVVKDIYYKKSPQHMSAANGNRRSDPTPVMSFDVTLADNGRYTKWLGNTARQQFNLLYGGNLPLGGLRYGSIIPIKKPTVSFPAVTSFKAWDSASAAAANMSSVDAVVSADMAGYDLSGNYISYQALASFIASDNGAQFGSMPSTLLDSDFTKMSMLQITTGIGSHRYGNIDWYKQMSSLSSKGMLTEYLIMNAEENFLRHQNQLLKNRIEMLLAGLTKARMHNYSKKVETLQVLAQAPTIPRIIDRELQVSDDEYVSAGGQGDGSDVGSVEYAKTPIPKGFTLEKAKIIMQTAKNIGVHPNDLAAVISFETVGTFSPSIKNPKSSATGLIQFMKGSGGTPGKYYGMTREQFASLTFESQMKYVERYFKEKGFRADKPRNVADLYTAVTGYGYKRGSEAYELNKVWDSNKDGYIDKGEMVRNSAFKAHQKDYMKQVDLSN